jgi:predicted HTH transcriptional regulator
MRSKTGFNGPYGMEKILRYYPKEERVELKLNILKALSKNPFLTKEQLRKMFYVGKVTLDDILVQCKEEGLFMKVGQSRKVLTRRGLEYLENNY